MLISKNCHTSSKDAFIDSSNLPPRSLSICDIKSSLNSCKKMERPNCISRIYEVLANSEKTIEELFQKMNEEESVDMDDIRRGVNQGVEMGILGITGLVSK
ncbi:uncharacterized protein LOC119644406 isoform X2 [Glossina fuscipes]|nr:uncharacterized protein LOC119644406 isoform X2 [Glossina fuscipes]